MASKAALVDAVKAFQRSDPAAKQAWIDLCDAELGGTKDPNQHDESVLQNFLSWCGGAQGGAVAAASSRPQRQGRQQTSSSKAELVDAVKTLQRSDPAIKQAWWDHCDQDLGGTKDPNQHDASVLENFLSWFAQGGAVAAAPSRPKRQATASRAELVDAVKNLQRSDPAIKEAWSQHCDAELGGTKDPNQHDDSVLQNFLSWFSQGGAVAAAPPRPQRQAPQRQARSMASKAELVDAVKNLQRSDAAIKQAWGDYCDAELGGTRDPNQHDERVLETFLSWFPQGGAVAAAPPRPQRQAIHQSPVAPQLAGGFGGQGGGMSMGAVMDLVSVVKMCQKTSVAFKEGWQTYCAMYGGGVNDPSRHEPGYISEFVNYLGQLAKADLGAAAAQTLAMQPQMGGKAGMGQKRSMDFRTMYGDSEPPRKKAAVSPMGGGDFEKAALVERMKVLQRNNPDFKAAWWAFTDDHHGGTHDPNRHEKEVLLEFMSQHE